MNRKTGGILDGREADGGGGGRSLDQVSTDKTATDYIG